MSPTRLLLIYTGGTIGMIQENPDAELKPFDLNSILAQVPEIASFGYQLDAHTFDQPIDSSNMQPAIWTELARVIAKNYTAYDGFVVLHGSDTMAYSASALSFMLQNLGKAVIFTGSQLPIGHIRTDAKENLITSIEIAAARLNGKARVPEVCIYFDYHLYRGNRAIKYNSEKFEAFHSPNYPLLAEAGIRIKYSDNDILPQPSAPFKAVLELDNRVGSLKLFPGLRPA
jgi:L-asparaginase